MAQTMAAGWRRGGMRQPGYRRKPQRNAACGGGIVSWAAAADRRLMKSLGESIMA